MFNSFNELARVNSVIPTKSIVVGRSFIHVGSVQSLGNSDGNAQERIKCHGHMSPVVVTKIGITCPLNGMAYNVRVLPVIDAR